MRMQILGTAAAEGWPGVFCGCETCARTRTAGGKNLRSRPSVQIDDIYKIDLSPDTYYHVVRFGLDLSKLAHLFFTHSHEDHFALDQLEYLGHPFAHNLKNKPLRIYGNAEVIRAIRSRYQDVDLPIDLTKLEAFKPVPAGELTFIPITANHNPREQCLNYIVQSNGATVLYASDTGLYGDATMEFISQYEFCLLVVECTMGPVDAPSDQHMAFSGVLELRDRLAKRGALAPEARWVITHFSHNVGLLHEELEAVAGPEGIEVAYDGMVLETPGPTDSS